MKLTSGQKFHIDVNSDVFEKVIQEESSVCLDVRTTVEHMSERISNSIHIDIYDDDFSQKVLSLDKSKTICIYCRSGHRSSLAADYLKRKGYKNVYNLKHGIVDWKNKGFDVETVL